MDSIVRRVPAPIKRGREGAFAFASGSFWIPDNVSDSSSSTVARIDARKRSRCQSHRDRRSFGRRHRRLRQRVGREQRRERRRAHRSVDQRDRRANSRGSVAQVHGGGRRRGVGSESNRRVGLADRSGDESRGGSRGRARANAGGRYLSRRRVRLVERGRNAGHTHRSAHEHGHAPVRGRKRRGRDPLGCRSSLGGRSQDWTTLAHRPEPHRAQVNRVAPTRAAAPTAPEGT